MQRLLNGDDFRPSGESGGVEEHLQRLAQRLLFQVALALGVIGSVLNSVMVGHKKAISY